MYKGTEVWETLAHQGGMRDKVGKKGMGQVVIHGILKNLLFVLFKTIHAHSLRRQVFDHVTHTHTNVFQTLSIYPSGNLFLNACNFKEFTLYPLSSKELLKDFNLESNTMRFEF